MPRTRTHERRERLNLALSPATRERLEELRRRTDADSAAEVIRRALAIYDDLLSVVDGGRKVAILGADGTPEEIVRLVP